VNVDGFALLIFIALVFAEEAQWCCCSKQDICRESLVAGRRLKEWRAAEPAVPAL